MTARRGLPKRRFGALFWVAVLLLGSAAVRIGLDVGPALAREANAAVKGHEPAQPEHGREAESGHPAPTDSNLDALFRELQSREAAVRLRETQIEDRMKALQIAEQTVDQKLAALQDAEEALSKTLSMADGASEADLTRLTAVYEKMKPKEAAPLFETMDPAFAAGFLARMKPEAAAGILARLSPQAAYTVSVILAGRNATVPKS